MDWIGSADATLRPALSAEATATASQRVSDASQNASQQCASQLFGDLADDRVRRRALRATQADSQADVDATQASLSDDNYRGARVALDTQLLFGGGAAPPRRAPPGAGAPEGAAALERASRGARCRGRVLRAPDRGAPAATARGGARGPARGARRRRAPGAGSRARALHRAAATCLATAESPDDALAAALDGDAVARRRPRRARTRRAPRSSSGRASWPAAGPASAAPWAPATPAPRGACCASTRTSTRPSPRRSRGPSRAPRAPAFAEERRGAYADAFRLFDALAQAEAPDAAAVGAAGRARAALALGEWDASRTRARARRPRRCAPPRAPPPPRRSRRAARRSSRPRAARARARARGAAPSAVAAARARAGGDWGGCAEALDAGYARVGDHLAALDACAVGPRREHLAELAALGAVDAAAARPAARRRGPLGRNAPGGRPLRGVQRRRAPRARGAGERRDALRFAAERLPEGHPVLKEALAACFDDAAEAFVAAAAGLHEPEFRYYDFVKDAHQRAARGDAAGAARTWRRCRRTLLDASWDGVGARVGETNATFGQKLRKSPKVHAVDAAILKGRDVARACKDAKAEALARKNEMKGGPPRPDLAAYSRYLADFDGRDDVAAAIAPELAGGLRALDDAKKARNKALKLVHDGGPKDKVWHAPRRRAEAAMAAAHEALDGDAGALRRHLCRLAPAPETFLAKRRVYLETLATASVCGYVVGLGDRHLDNLLLADGDGAVVHIDMGYAFGTATTALPVPELIPFRLTRELARALAPSTATPSSPTPRRPRSPRSAARATRRRSSRSSRPSCASPSSTGSTAGTATRRASSTTRRRRRRPPPRRRRRSRAARPRAAPARARPPRRRSSASPSPRQARRAHPVALLVEELDRNTNAMFKPMKEQAKVVARGDPGDARRDVEGDVLDVRDQVRVLVDLATDPNCLGRHWKGLNLWC
ncbi:hypothetical protein SO694_00083063 [Aureococcus anophagefferens]|uniref:non-specific serine/threonine protein kinase n=1 Tax=Aureococcus anophagefferens TaxID=44056 RepID=A0ABR1FJC5_AURAN